MLGLMRIVILMLGLSRCHANPDQKERKKDESNGLNHQIGVNLDSENQGYTDERLAGDLDLALKGFLRNLEDNSKHYLKHQKRINMEFHNAQKELQMQTLLSDDMVDAHDTKRSDDSMSHHGQLDIDEIYSFKQDDNSEQYLKPKKSSDMMESHHGQKEPKPIETYVLGNIIAANDRKRSHDSMSHHGQIDYTTDVDEIYSIKQRDDNSGQYLKQQKSSYMMESHHGQIEPKPIEIGLLGNIIAANDRKRSHDSMSHHGQIDYTTDVDEIYSFKQEDDNSEQYLKQQKSSYMMESHHGQIEPQNENIWSSNIRAANDRKRSDDSSSHHGQTDYTTDAEKIYSFLHAEDNSEQNLKQQKSSKRMESHHGQTDTDKIDAEKTYSFVHFEDNLDQHLRHKEEDYPLLQSKNQVKSSGTEKHYVNLADDSMDDFMQPLQNILLHHGQKDVNNYVHPYLSGLQYRRKPRSDLKQFIRRNEEKHRQLHVTSDRKDSQSTEWMENLRMPVSRNEFSFFNQWANLMESLTGLCSGERENLTIVDHKQALLTMGSSKNFMNIFWPFRFDVNIMNQRLALSGLTNKLFNGSDQDTKEAFFKVIAYHQDVKPPSKPSEIVYSFDDPEVMKGLYRTGMLSIPADLKEASKNLLSENERRAAIRFADKALELINMTDPELYQSIVQMIATIGFYKEDNPKYLGGSATSDIGIIWLNVYDLDDWTVTFMAEQIVHEFVHNSLFYAELVHGTYHHDADLSEARPMSAIRRTYRNYDKSFHAAYVSACLITLHTRIGEMGRAEELARTFPGAVADLNVVNDETGVLNRSGRAMLNFLNDYACLTRL